jgi:L-fuculose-phosphate aldolase
MIDHDAMILAHARAQVVDYAQRLRRDGLAILTSGNVSAREGDLVAISPSGLDYDDYRPELICVVAQDGSPVDTPLRPSTELPMHLAAYRRTGAGAVVHTHSPFATTLACSEIAELPAIHYLIASMGGPVRRIPYAMPGTEELARLMDEGLRDREAVLLGNHGALTVGGDLRQAYDRSLLLEWLCTIFHQALALPRAPLLLTGEQLAEMSQILAVYDQNAGTAMPSQQ